MAKITVVNNSAVDIYVSISANGSDNNKGNTAFWKLNAYGGSDAWGRSDWQVVGFTRGQSPGVLVETVLGVPDRTVYIH